MINNENKSNDLNSDIPIVPGLDADIQKQLIDEMNDARKLFTENKYIKKNKKKRTT